MALDWNIFWERNFSNIVRNFFTFFRDLYCTIGSDWFHDEDGFNKEELATMKKVWCQRSLKNKICHLPFAKIKYNFLSQLSSGTAKQTLIFTLATTCKDIDTNREKIFLRFPVKSARADWRCLRAVTNWDVIQTNSCHYFLVMQVCRVFEEVNFHKMLHIANNAVTRHALEHMKRRLGDNDIRFNGW